MADHTDPVVSTFSIFDAGDAGDYPTDETLQQIRTHEVAAEVLNLARLSWHWPDFVRDELLPEERDLLQQQLGEQQSLDEVRHVRFATGGWSGNEAIIRALTQNLTLRALGAWQLSTRGGLHIYRYPPDTTRPRRPSRQTLYYREQSTRRLQALGGGLVRVRYASNLDHPGLHAGFLITSTRTQELWYGPVRYEKALAFLHGYRRGVDTILAPCPAFFPDAAGRCQLCDEYRNLHTPEAITAGADVEPPPPRKE